MEWEILYDKQNRIWNWRLELPNGWTAYVTDDSQHGYPRKPTRYLAAVISRSTVIQAKEYRSELSAAKQEALGMALACEPCGVGNGL